MGATIKNIGVLTRVLRGLKHQNLLNLFIFCGLLLFNRPSMAENEIETPSQNTAQEAANPSIVAYQIDESLVRPEVLEKEVTLVEAWSWVSGKNFESNKWVKSYYKDWNTSKIGRQIKHPSLDIELTSTESAWFFNKIITLLESADVPDSGQAGYYRGYLKKGLNKFKAYAAYDQKIQTVHSILENSRTSVSDIESSFSLTEEGEVTQEPNSTPKSTQFPNQTHWLNDVQSQLEENIASVEQLNEQIESIQFIPNSELVSETRATEVRSYLDRTRRSLLSQRSSQILNSKVTQLEALLQLVAEEDQRLITLSNGLNTNSLKTDNYGVNESIAHEWQRSYVRAAQNSLTLMNKTQAKAAEVTQSGGNSETELPEAVSAAFTRLTTAISAQQTSAQQRIESAPENSLAAVSKAKAEQLEQKARDLFLTRLAKFDEQIEQRVQSRNNFSQSATTEYTEEDINSKTTQAQIDSIAETSAAQETNLSDQDHLITTELTALQNIYQDLPKLIKPLVDESWKSTQKTWNEESASHPSSEISQYYQTAQTGRLIEAISAHRTKQFSLAQKALDDQSSETTVSQNTLASMDDLDHAFTSAVDSLPSFNPQAAVEQRGAYFNQISGEYQKATSDSLDTDDLAPIIGNKQKALDLLEERKTFSESREKLKEELLKLALSREAKNYQLPLKSSTVNGETESVLDLSLLAPKHDFISSDTQEKLDQLEELEKALAATDRKLSQLNYYRLEGLNNQRLGQSASLTESMTRESSFKIGEVFQINGARVLASLLSNSRASYVAKALEIRSEANGVKKTKTDKKTGKTIKDSEDEPVTYLTTFNANTQAAHQRALMTIDQIDQHLGNLSEQFDESSATAPNSQSAHTAFESEIKAIKTAASSSLNTVEYLADDLNTHWSLQNLGYSMARQNTEAEAFAKQREQITHDYIAAMSGYLETLGTRKHLSATMDALGRPDSPSGAINTLVRYETALRSLEEGEEMLSLPLIEKMKERRSTPMPSTTEKYKDSPDYMQREADRKWSFSIMNLVKNDGLIKEGTQSTWIKRAQESLKSGAISEETFSRVSQIFESLNAQVSLWNARRNNGDSLIGKLNTELAALEKLAQANSWGAETRFNSHIDAFNESVAKYVAQKPEFALTSLDTFPMDANKLAAFKLKLTSFRGVIDQVTQFNAEELTLNGIAFDAQSLVAELFQIAKESSWIKPSTLGVTTESLTGLKTDAEIAIKKLEENLLVHQPEHALTSSAIENLDQIGSLKSQLLTLREKILPLEIRTSASIAQIEETQEAHLSAHQRFNQIALESDDPTHQGEMQKTRREREELIQQFSQNYPDAKPNFSTMGLDESIQLSLLAGTVNHPQHDLNPTRLAGIQVAQEKFHREAVSYWAEQEGKEPHAEYDESADETPDYLKYACNEQSVEYNFMETLVFKPFIETVFLNAYPSIRRTTDAINENLSIIEANDPNHRPEYINQVRSEIAKNWKALHATLSSMDRKINTFFKSVGPAHYKVKTATILEGYPTIEHEEINVHPAFDDLVQYYSRIVGMKNYEQNLAQTLGLSSITATGSVIAQISPGAVDDLRLRLNSLEDQTVRIGNSTSPFVSDGRIKYYPGTRQPDYFRLRGISTSVTEQFLAHQSNEQSQRSQEIENTNASIQNIGSVTREIATALPLIKEFQMRGYSTNPVVSELIAKLVGQSNTPSNLNDLFTDEIIQDYSQMLKKWPNWATDEVFVSPAYGEDLYANYRHDLKRFEQALSTLGKYQKLVTQNPQTIPQGNYEEQQQQNLAHLVGAMQRQIDQAMGKETRTYSVGNFQSLARKIQLASAEVQELENKALLLERNAYNSGANVFRHPELDRIYPDYGVFPDIPSGHWGSYFNTIMRGERNCPDNLVRFHYCRAKANHAKLMLSGHYDTLGDSVGTQNAALLKKLQIARREFGVDLGLGFVNLASGRDNLNPMNEEKMFKRFEQVAPEFFKVDGESCSYWARAVDPNSNQVTGESYADRVDDMDEATALQKVENFHSPVAFDYFNSTNDYLNDGLQLTLTQKIASRKERDWTERFSGSILGDLILAADDLIQLETNSDHKAKFSPSSVQMRFLRDNPQFVHFVKSSPHWNASTVKERNRRMSFIIGDRKNPISDVFTDYYEDCRQRVLGLEPERWSQEYLQCRDKRYALIDYLSNFGGQEKIVQLKDHLGPHQRCLESIGLGAIDPKTMNNPFYPLNHVRSGSTSIKGAMLLPQTMPIRIPVFAENSPSNQQKIREETAGQLNAIREDFKRYDLSDTGIARAKDVSNKEIIDGKDIIYSDTPATLFLPSADFFEQEKYRFRIGGDALNPEICEATLAEILNADHCSSICGILILKDAPTFKEWKLARPAKSTLKSQLVVDHETSIQQNRSRQSGTLAAVSAHVEPVVSPIAHVRPVRRAARTNNATDIGAESFKTPREQNEIAALQEEIRESNETIEEIKIKISGIETQIDSIKGFKPLIRGQLNNALAKQKRILSNEEEKLRLRNVKLARLRS